MRLRGAPSASIFLFLFSFALGALAQQNSAPQDATQTPSKQNPLPDAPTPKLPEQPRALPNTAPLPAQTPQPAPAELPPPSTAATQAAPRPLAPPKTVADTKDLDNVIRVNVRLVTVPVSVKDSGGKLVDGLQQNDFAVYDNNLRQNIKYFSSEPFPLSTAIVVDTGMSDLTLRRIQQTLNALTGAFGPYDEITLFSYGSTVTQQSDFGNISNERFNVAVRQVRKVEGKANAGVPINSGPLANGPMINNIPFDPNANTRVSSPAELRSSHVLNDAILQAAQALARQDPARRKMILVISDGQEYRSRNSYSDVLKVLLTNNITVDAIAVDTAAIAGLNKLEQIHLPRQGYGNLLPKYANATGGSVFTELTQGAIEAAYQRATYEARNQYTLGYSPGSEAPGTYHQIEVRVHRPGLKVFARDGYYPLPPKQ